MNWKSVDSINSLLIVDDDQDYLSLINHLVQEKIHSKVTISRYPTQALTLALEYFFDIVIIDVTMDYNGSPFGGFELYKALLEKYGKDSLILYSQYITDDLLKRFNYNFNFIEKDTNIMTFSDSLISKIYELRKRQTCFVAMPFDKKYDDLFFNVKICIEKCNYKCVRVDEQVFTKSIIEKVFDEIRDSKIVVFLANDKNPNAFYECGYASALKKEIITITDFYENLPFDIRDRSAISYANDLKKLQSDLSHKLSHITKSS